MTLDLSSLENALAALDKSLAFLHSDLADNPDLAEQFRAAAIQAFEFTHELAFKMMRRFLETQAARPASVDQMSYMEVVRSAAEAGLVEDVARFRDYREKRNITSHTYDLAKARQIAAVLEAFRADTRYLLDELARRNLDHD